MVNQLHSAYQGQFKDWLYSKGYNKNFIDLVKMIDKQWNRNDIFEINQIVYNIDNFLLIFKQDSKFTIENFG